MLQVLNRLFVVFILLAALGGILLSLVVLFFPESDGFELESVRSMDQNPDFRLLGDDLDIWAGDSPYPVNYTIRTPPLEEFDQLYLEVYSEGRYLGEISCLDFLYAEDFVGATELVCTAYIPYHYSPSQEYMVFATIYGEGYEYSSGPAHVNIDWASYEDYFWEVSINVVMLIGLSYLLLIFPITLAVAYISSKVKRAKGGYTIFSLLNPFANKKTLLQKFNSFMVSPYFWLFEIMGILLIMVYMLATAQVWESPAALIAFLLSGLMAFIVPFLWCAAWWYADFREREPLPVLVTFFLWGMLAALMAIGINTVMGIAFAAIGLGFLGSFLVAPVAEEFYKGSGISVLAEHREFGSIEDGFVYGFVIGMGFSFIEDWIYLIDTPMGSDILMWLVVFFLRSIFFSANHGLYTAITGGVIGFLIEKGYKAPALGLLIGFPIAAFFHAMHNSSEALAFLFGESGALASCCILMPLFDYGGLGLLLILFIWALFRKKHT